ncbi:MAG TPA: COX15/CtaA family protein, partial [Solirubrobacteraceae bacterium]|nr:COX15/CtaA family protein [Solirubrobacteraceae bacterium]
MPARLKSFTVTPERYALIARSALVAFTLIVVTGVAVRVTGSGLGCPTWPKCTETSLYTELNTHGVIEFGNRMLTGFVTLAALAALAGAYRRRPYRRDLMRLAVLLPLGVVAQIVLGGFTVLYDLRPGFVMSHFMLSMLILVACV